MESEFISKKIEALEQELQSLKNIFLGQSKNKVVSLKGLLKGIQISEEDFKEAEKSLFSSS